LARTTSTCYDKQLFTVSDAERWKACRVKRTVTQQRHQHQSNQFVDAAYASDGPRDPSLGSCRYSIDQQRRAGKTVLEAISSLQHGAVSAPGGIFNDSTKKANACTLGWNATQ